MTVLLEAEDLVVAYETARGRVQALDGLDLRLEPGETLAIVGESGSGKSTLGLAVGRLLPSAARRESGSLRLQGQEVFEAAPEALRRLRRESLGFVFQNPMSALDPTMRVGRQVARAAGGLSTAGLQALLAKAGLDEAERVAASFPHELSGGMAQRVVIAMAIARGPTLLIADEPTASLDVSIRGRVMRTLLELQSAAGASLIVLTHDLHLAARSCQRLAVMYGGRIVESGRSATVLSRPAHPYTKGLLAAAAGNEAPGEDLRPIPGLPPLLRERARDCSFAPRCDFAEARCRELRPEVRDLERRSVVCHFAERVLVEAGP
ncbi:MAG: ABC transporter ATP-binding protein [Rhodospirillales bacterium]